MREIEWQDVLANLDRLTDEALWEIVKISTRELRLRNKQEYPKILITPFVPIPHGIAATELIVDEVKK